MKKRRGGKFGNNHSSIIDAAEVIADISNACPLVTEIRPGKIKSPRNRSGRSRRVKVLVEGHSLLVRVVANAALQEFRLYTTNNAAACSWMKHRIEREHFTFETVGI
jgi:hypothetical protein